MRQLSGLDNSFLAMETPTTYGHVSSLAIFEPGEHTLTFSEVRDLVAERLHLVAPFRRRLVTVPLGLDHPFWIEDPDFDLDYHLRHIAVPPPGDERQLAELAAELAAKHLDRRRPLWEMYIIEGLEGGAVAELTKIHHACIDGVSGAEILGVLLDISANPPPVPPPAKPWRPEHEPSQVELLGRGVAGLLAKPRVGFRLARRAVPRLGAIANNFQLGLPTLRRPREILSSPGTQAPRTPMNGTITPHRRFAFGSLPLSDIKLVKQQLGGTVNDVVMAMCAGVLRTWLIEHDALPSDPLLAMVPVSVRTDEQRGTFGNRVSAMVVELPTNERDPLVRYERVQAATRLAKEQHGAIPAEVLQDFAQFTPPSVLGMASRVAARSKIADRVNPPFNVVISNVPGPQFPLYSAGAMLRGIYPLSAITDGIGLNMTLMSYNGNLDFGLLACREMIPDIWRMIEALGEELAVLVKAARAEG
ncbi:MAG TPA: wax ester/triacylglycerol synthase family O-acyltransferase [Acidimicrobiia bacterium]|jgi:WS/DGAT/MGAT family acyltransferase|nr:wax ester/triacylglycerol synthase family O-acyltransferase [Acidimicrobiia bacterium]